MEEKEDCWREQERGGGNLPDEKGPGVCRM